MTSTEMRALIVEDDSSWQQILSEILIDLGLIVDVAGNLEDALNDLKSDPHRLAVVDLSLAEVDHNNSDGLRVLEAVRRLDPGCRTILLTGFATVELAVSVLTEYGAFTFLRKENFQRSQFREVVRRALAIVPAPLNSSLLESEISITSSANGSVVKPSPRGNNVLVVEDDAGWRSILSEIITDRGRQVRPCASYGDALGCLRREKFALAIIDLSLTDSFNFAQEISSESLEGYQLLANTRSAGVPTIVVSGVASAEEIQRAYKDHSIFAYLEKQAFDRTTFQRLVEEASLSPTIGCELECLTVREREVFDLMARGMANKEIAETLVITTNTVKRHLKSIFEKLNVHTRSAAASKSSSSPLQR